MVHTDKDFLADIEGDCNLYHTLRAHVSFHYLWTCQWPAVGDSIKVTDGSSDLYNTVASSVAYANR